MFLGMSRAVGVLPDLAVSHHLHEVPRWWVRSCCACLSWGVAACEFCPQGSSAHGATGPKVGRRHSLLLSCLLRQMLLHGGDAHQLQQDGGHPASSPAPCPSRAGLTCGCGVGVRVSNATLALLQSPSGAVRAGKVPAEAGTGHSHRTGSLLAAKAGKRAGGSCRQPGCHGDGLLPA